MAQWNRNTVPKCENKKCSDEVLVTVERTGYGGKLYRRVIKAVYFPHHHCTVEDMGWSMDDGIPGDWEYSEDDDSYWIPQGWYEVGDYFDGFSHAEITDKVIAWSRMPKPCELRIKDLSNMPMATENENFDVRR